jgi:hypothetical protein
MKSGDIELPGNPPHSLRKGSSIRLISFNAAVNIDVDSSKGRYNSSENNHVTKINKKERNRTNHENDKPILGAMFTSSAAA